MMHVEINLPAHVQVPVHIGPVREVIQREHDGSVGRVLKWHHAVGGDAGLRRVEDVFFKKKPNAR